MKYIKMQDIIDELVKHNKKVFTVADVAKIAEKPMNYASKILAKSSKVARIEKGKYYLTGINTADIYEIASQIVFPSYVSMFAVFQFYSLTEQAVFKYSVITIKRRMPVVIGQNRIEFIAFDRVRFFGYKKINNAYIATVEKAIVDSLYTGSPPINYLNEIFSEAIHRKMIDRNVLSAFALKMKSKIVLKKLSVLFKANTILPDYE